jgi:hypothetical protein
MQSDNLLLPPDTPFGPTLAMTSNEITDTDGGKVFLHAYNTLCKEKDVLCPILLGSDGTHVDALGKCMIEPCMFSLGIIGLHDFPILPEAWRILGYPPNIVSPRSTTDPFDDAPH